MKTLFKRRMTAAVIGKIAAFVAITAIALLASCTNPFFETLLSDREVSASGSSGGYRVRFAINDGTDTILDTKTTTGATLTDFPPDPKRAGYAFTGWNIAVDGSGNAFTVVTAVIADITVYAQWLVVPPGSYAVIFDRNDESGAIHRLLTVAEGNSLGGAFPGDPSRAGFGFAGWNTAADGSGSAFTVATAVWRDTKVYAQWGTYSYTVSFNKNGGDTEPSPAAVTVTSPATTVRTLPTLPIRPNPSGGEYSFAGWKTAPDGSESDFTTATVVPADITVYAHWVVVPPGSCAVVFHQNDETGLIYRHITVEQGHSLSALPGSPSRTGYVFSGSWNTKPDGSGDLFTGMDPIWSETHIYAQWGTYSYTVTFDGNGATTEASPATKTVASPATTVGALPTPPAKTGYLFGGWYDTTAGTGTPFTAGTPVTGTITVYAKWNNYTYTVTFAGNGATTEASPATKTVASPATTLAEAGMSTLPTPIRTGYDFKGWFPATNGSGLEFTSLTSVDADKTTVYAKWAIKTYTVTFNNNYGTTEPYAIRNVTYPSFTGTGTGTNFPADPPGWTEQGTGTKYIFNGWNTAANGSGDVFNAGTTLVIDPISVYAQWKEVPPNTYVVTFKLNDGNYGFHDVRTTDEGTPLGSANFPADPTREGYTFAGVWNTQANGQGTIFNAGTEVNADITVYAQWTAITYTVTFAGNGATTEASPTSKDVTRPVTNVGTLPAPPTREGYNFGGWYDTTTGTGTEFTAGTTVNANKTVYAKWNSYSYTVTF
ncbi:MAG: InlB B-repeat-containing protein, partial [Treponema sp.]|nr:InlB B-repeat-containing protein [Treponema sp.]